ncbi:MAG: hypothetical protein HYY36_05405 [Gammaproteobacteria bacterium]|nr:hypothetical protein [Gammaproteobacteria bacterium]
MNKAGGLEAVFLEEDQRDAPGVLLDELLAVAAAGAAGGSAIGAVDAQDTAVGDARKFAAVAVPSGFRSRCRGDAVLAFTLSDSKGYVDPGQSFPQH